MQKTRSVLFSAALALTLAGGVSACGGNDDSPSATKGTSTSQSSPQSGSTKADDKSGSTADSSASADSTPTVQIRPGLPKGYPESDLPLAAGKVVGGSPGAFAMSGEAKKGWTVRVLGHKSVPAMLSEATAALKKKGFKQKGPARTNKQYSSVVLQNADYTLDLTVAKQKKGALAIYAFQER